MKISLKFYLLVLSVAIAILAIVLFISLQILDRNSNSSDVSVALNATDEFGYPSTIFVISRSYNGDLDICGGSIVDNGVAVTAAHCVDGMKDIYIGTEVLDTRDFRNFIKIESVDVKKGWETDFAKGDWSIDNMQYDFAILHFNSSIVLPVSTIETFEPGCGYEIVSYGTRLEEIDQDFIDLSVPRNKQRISVCIENSSDNLMFILPESDTGLCFGDSGSPVYKTNSNKIVGFISSLINLETSQNICALNNFGLAVRLDTNYSLVSGADFTGTTYQDSESESDFNEYASSIFENYKTEKPLNLEDSIVKSKNSDLPAQSNFGDTIELDANLFFGIAIISAIGIVVLLVFVLYLLYKGFIEVSIANEERLFNNKQYT